LLAQMRPWLLFHKAAAGCQLQFQENVRSQDTTYMMCWR